MNIEKYLRQQAAKDSEKFITEEDRLFCKQLIEKIAANKKNKKLKKRNKKRDK